MLLCSAGSYYLLLAPSYGSETKKWFGLLVWRAPLQAVGKDTYYRVLLVNWLLVWFVSSSIMYNCYCERCSAERVKQRSFIVVLSWFSLFPFPIDAHGTSTRYGYLRSEWLPATALATCTSWYWGIRIFLTFVRLVVCSGTIKSVPCPAFMKSTDDGSAKNKRFT